ncbi:MAG: hypothetical protein GWM90_22285, partial [Gemmatimonadetes bacterium]|nr:hypothetical protein [Gemmatimonadota bacterium]NIQ57339.1 hypothetical protein [Gemmatimonadota bacterium]NIU77500.1 hypothetical protein [Gammaproteobacteria bacterium]NIX46712.1 hypothetical protein [Gemmatimonadota bacterium]
MTDRSTGDATAASIREYMATKLSWQPGTSEPKAAPEPEPQPGPEPQPEPEPDLEPWAAAPVTPPDPAREGVAEAAPASAAGSVRAEASSSVEDAPSAHRSGPGVTAEELGLVEYELDGADSSTRALVALTDMLVGLLEYRDPFFRGSSSLTRLLAMNVAEEM